MRLTPTSTAARIVSIAAASSVSSPQTAPPPIAHAPSATTDASNPEFPSVRYFICGFLVLERSPRILSINV